MTRPARFAHLILAACAMLVARVQMNLASNVSTDRLPPVSRLVAGIVGR